MQTAHSSVQYKDRPDDISLSISVCPACGSALMPRQGPPGYNPYTWGSGINYLRAIIITKAILLRRNAPEIPAARREARPVRSAHPHLSPRTGIARNGSRHDAQIQCAPRVGDSAPNHQPDNQYAPVPSRTAPPTPPSHIRAEGCSERSAPAPHRVALRREGVVRPGHLRLLARHPPTHAHQPRGDPL